MSSVYGFSIEVEGSGSSTYGFSLTINENNRVKILRQCGVENSESLDVKILNSSDSVVLSGSTTNGFFYFDFNEISGTYKIQVNNSSNLQEFTYVNGEPINEEYIYLGKIYKVESVDFPGQFTNEIEI